jgi:glyoxylase-like metal-dependent hydrolase (beta-lactamase superfamily II)
LDDDIAVSAVADVSGNTMGVELFDGPLTKEQRLEFMPDGKAPAAVNVYLVKTAGKTYLMDTGYGNVFKENKINPSDIEAVLMTHSHGDHIGGLLKEDGTPVFDAAPVLTAKPENDYWLDAKTPNSDKQKQTAQAYGDRYKTFAFGDTVAPGIVAIDANGHTPGHTAFLVGTGARKILVAGDFLHAAALQFPNPDESASFDVDKKQAAEMRKKLMQMAIDNGWLIAGMHIPGGIGAVKSDGRGGFEFTAELAPDLNLGS